MRTDFLSFIVEKQSAELWAHAEVKEPANFDFGGFEIVKKLPLVGGLQISRSF